MGKYTKFRRDVVNRRFNINFFIVFILCYVPAYIVSTDLDNILEKFVVLFVVPLSAMILGQLHMAETVRQRKISSAARTK